MNLALQTRRAVITLSLMALALACVAAKTATRHDALSARGGSMATESVQVSAPPAAIKVAAKAKPHAETRIIRI